MGKVQLFEISLRDSRVVYSPGEALCGTVTIRTSAVLHYKAIKVNCVGSCGVSNKVNETSWNIEEQYFSGTFSLADKGMLQPGEHTFPFQFLLPASAPTSFEGPFGKVMHQVKGVIETRKLSKDYKTSKLFYILRPLDLNEIPDIDQLSCATSTKKFNYKLVKSGQLLLSVTSDLRGYIVGQVIKIHTEVENKSGRDTGAIVAALIQKVAYRSKRCVYDLRTIAEVEGAPVKAWKHAVWDEQILVPALPQSILQGCSLIQMDYYLQVTVKSPEVSVTLPIYIGNIPVSQARLGLRHSISQVQAPVVPSAPPADDDQCGSTQPMDNVSIPTKCHSQQQANTPFSYAPELNFPNQQMENLGSPSHPTLCLSTGSTVPYYAEGAVVPVPTASTLILPPEYSTWGYPYDAPPSYEQSCSEAGVSNEN
ncbi:PREDICTED: arrestin domain-containing protein 1 isoform X2 [Nanorana parkeri]|uniref:arrestin domain-containing protein 1 isoform X2 n=1 Tax=Nanorana parkeri TaxID=125878 RepID=UPI000853FEEE|nr:PREDICTED: arrestin domain-containing protein 1 isoform X2 [Nanorana parkeri]